MTFIKNSELIINPDGSLYHISLRPEHIGDYVFFVGDPDRVSQVSKYFDNITHKAAHREFISHCGILNGKFVTVISTGIGTDNIDIVLNELDAAVNIDLDKRMPKTNHKTLNIIRIGTSGSMNPDIPADSFLTSVYAIGTDGLLNYYDFKNSDDCIELAEGFIKNTNYPDFFARPYAAKGTESLINQIASVGYKGITVTACGFYAPQGRELRYKLSVPNLIDLYTGYSYNGYHISNFEMETSAIYGLANMLGHNVCSVSAIVANRLLGTYTGNPAKTIDALIKHTLESVLK